VRDLPMHLPRPGRLLLLIAYVSVLSLAIARTHHALRYLVVSTIIDRRHRRLSVRGGTGRGSRWQRLLMYTAVLIMTVNKPFMKRVLSIMASEFPDAVGHRHCRASTLNNVRVD
jgi:hypothetical protein